MLSRMAENVVDIHTIYVVRNVNMISGLGLWGTKVWNMYFIENTRSVQRTEGLQVTLSLHP